MSVSWSGADLLRRIDGRITEFPPIQVLFALHRRRATGALTVRRRGADLTLSVQSGKVIGVSGAPKLLAGVGVSGASDADLMALVGAAIGTGMAPDDALTAAADGLGDLLAGMVGATGGSVRYVDGTRAAGAPIPLPQDIPRIIRGGLERVRTPERVTADLQIDLTSEVQLSLPRDATPDAWGLTPVALRLLRLIKKNAERKPSVAQVIRKGGDERLVALDLLVQLGLLTLHPTQPREEPEPEVDPEDLLTTDLNRMRAQAPWEVLELTAGAVNDEGIDRASRTISQKYHPDRFHGDAESIRSLAADCFAVVQEAYNALRSPTLRQEIQARLEAQARGEVYVTDRDRAEAEVRYSQGQVSFRKKDFGAAARSFSEALERDPENWRYTYMRLRSRYLIGEEPGLEVAQTILALDGPRGLTRADVLFEVGEIFMREGLTEKAHEQYEAVLKLHPEHIGARRRVRIKKMRDEAAEEESAGALFGGLFRRKKK